MTHSLKTLILLSSALAGVAMPESSHADEIIRTIPAETKIPDGQKPGEMPYEMRWSMRVDDNPQVVFSDLTGWTLDIVRGDAEVGLHATVAQRIWQPQTAELVYKGGTTRTTVVARPLQPIVIDSGFDAARAWIFGGWYRRAQNDEKPPVVTVLLKDSQGKPVRLELGKVISGHWSIEQGVLPGRDLKAGNFPMTFEGIEFDEVDLPDAVGSMYIESLTFYTQNRNPAQHPYRQLDASFPTSNDGMLPTPPAGVSVQAEQRNSIFSSDANGKKLEFRVDPRKGMLTGIEARWDAGEWFQPTADGGIQTGTGSGRKNMPGEFASSRWDGDRLVATWKAQAPSTTQWTATYWISGRTLLVDIECKGGEATGLGVGEVVNLPGARGIFVPYMVLNRVSHLTTKGPLIACGDSAFVSVLPDLYHSDFSDLTNDASEDRSAPDGRLRLMTGTTYSTLSDGTRNDLRERLMISVSSEFADVLPNMRNPVSIHREEMADHFYYLAYYPHLNLFRTLKQYGLDRVIASHHVFANFIAGPGEPYELLGSFSFRWRPVDLIGVHTWQAYGKALKELGYRFGTYTYYPDLHPVNEYWDEAHVALKPDGTLNWGWWYGGFHIKMNAAAKMAREATLNLKQLYESDATYLDIHTVMGPAASDYEAGVEGAGIARYAVLGNTDTISAVRSNMGWTTGEGYHRWLYAGISDADYATLLYSPQEQSSAELPLLVDFDLLKIQPFAHGTMMGFEPKYFLNEHTQEWRELYEESGRGHPPETFYRYMTASLGYGHMGALGYDYVPVLSRSIHLYAIMMGVQHAYLSDHVKSIEYHDGSAYQSTSDALRNDIVKNGRLRVTYQRGLVVHVNYNASASWEIDLNGTTYELPANGWLIEKPGEILSYSALENGHRVDVVNCPEYIYINTGDHTYRSDALGVQVRGAVWMKRNEAGGFRVIPCGDLGPWEKISAADGFSVDQHDYKLANIPADRGLLELIVDAPTLLGKPADQVATTGTMEVQADGRVKLQFDPESIDFTLE